MAAIPVPLIEHSSVMDLLEASNVLEAECRGRPTNWLGVIAIR